MAARRAQGYSACSIRIAPRTGKIIQMRRNAFLLCAVAAVLVSERPARAQGCIVARSSELTAGPESQGGYLVPGEWDITVGYRHQFSFRHFVGPTEQVYRIQQGTQVMNKINL